MATIPRENTVIYNILEQFVWSEGLNHCAKKTEKDGEFYAETYGPRLGWEGPGL